MEDIETRNILQEKKYLGRIAISGKAIIVIITFWGVEVGSPKRLINNIFRRLFDV